MGMLLLFARDIHDKEEAEAKQAYSLFGTDNTKRLDECVDIHRKFVAAVNMHAACFLTSTQIAFNLI